MDDLGSAPTAEKPRTLARRRQVLEAAARCFRRHGFHACSMTQISTEAGMSVGHIYRYFSGKDAIIAAIVREDVDEILCKMTEFPMDASDLRTALIERAREGVTKAADPDQAALMIEIRAEAARNPAIRALVRDSDNQVSQAMRAIIAKAVCRPLDPADLDARVEMFHLIFQGLGLRSIVNPQVDHRPLACLIERTIAGILD